MQTVYMNVTFIVQ